jgi:hypothetical protein
MPTLLSSITHEPTIWERALADGRPINLGEAQRHRGTKEQRSREQGREAEGIEGLRG